MFQTKVIEKRHVICFQNLSPESRAVCEIMWESKVDPDKPQMTIRRMRIACWMPKATDTHSEYVILIAFSLQQWLHERASLLRYTYIACRVILSDHLHVSLPSDLLPLLLRVFYVPRPSHSPCLVKEYLVKDTNHGVRYTL